MLLNILARRTARYIPQGVRSCSHLTARKVSVPQHVRLFSDDAKRAAARLELNKIYEELQSPDEIPEVELASVETLLEWNKQPLDSLSAEQLDELGDAWYEGVEGDLEPDLPRAFEVWTVASEKGCVEAAYSRAVMLRDGRGVPKDSESAFKCMSELANTKNYGLAHYATAIMLSTGEGVPQDHTKAFHHFTQAGHCGVVPAIHNLANAYATGQGVEQSDPKALKMYELAVELGDPAAKFTLGVWLYKGRGVEVNKARAFQLQLEAAQAGHPVAMFNTGAAHMEGTAVQRDFHVAALWFEKAAERGLPEAAVNLGSLYRKGMGGDEPGAIKKDLHKALEVFRKYAHIPMCQALANSVEIDIKEGK